MHRVPHMNRTHRSTAVAALLAVAACFSTAHAATHPVHPFLLPQRAQFAALPGSTIASADFDHDGRQDLALPVGDSTIFVYFGRADGALGEPLRVPLASVGNDYIGDLFTGDVDGDGSADLVLLGSGIHFVRNRGDGTFEPDRLAPEPTTGSLAAALEVGRRSGRPPGDGARSVDWGGRFGSLGDVDGDGRADFYILGQWLWRSVGASGFGTPVQMPAGLSNTSTLWGLVRLADVSGDGLADIVAVGFDSVAVRLSLGGGTFSAPVLSAIPCVAAVSDQDGDGRADLWILGRTFGAVCRSNGDGTFAPPVVPVNDAFFEPAACIGDLDGDGRPDVLVDDRWSMSEPDVVRLYVGQPDGSCALQGLWAGGVGGVSCMLDYDGDGTMDFATASMFGSDLRLVKGLGSGRYRDASVCPTEAGNAVALADLDGDHRADLLAVSGLSKLSVFRGAASGWLPFVQSCAVPTYPFGMTVDDLDGDGHLDALVTGTDNPTAVSGWLHGVGDGTFGASHPLPGGDGHGAWQAVTGDFDGDGSIDVVDDGGGASLCVAWGRGGGVFDGPVATGVAVGGSALTRLAGDARPSLVVVGDSLRVVRAGADRTWTVLSSASLAGVWGPVAITADLDGDGQPDVILPHSPGAIEVRLASGAHFGPGTTYACGNGTWAIEGIAAGDVDGDGHADIVISCGQAQVVGGMVTIWYGAGAGLLADRVDFDPGGTTAGVCALGDVNGDGALDLAVASGLHWSCCNSFGRDVLVLLNAGGSPPATVAAAPAGLTIGRPWPNPRRGATAVQIECALAVVGAVRLELLDVQGRRVCERTYPALGPGRHALALPATAAPPGLYFVRVTQGDVRAARRVALLD